jgi:type IV secretory pathway TrbL component
MSDREEDSVSRRTFFSSVGKSVAVGVGAVATVAAGSAAAEEEAPSGALYRETDHVKKVYELSRF